MKILATVFIVFCAITINLMAQWESDRKISTSEGSVFTNENMAKCLVVSGNNVHVVWGDGQKNGKGVWYKHSTDNGINWSNDLRLTSLVNSADFPSIAVVDTTVHVGYRDVTGSSNISYYLRSKDNGNTWDSPYPVGTYYWWPAIAATGQKVYFALNSNDPNNSEVWCGKSMDNGDSWQAVSRISNDTNRSEDPAIFALGNYVYLAWNDKRSGKMEIYYRYSSDNGVTWGPETNMSHANGIFTYSPSLYATGSDVDLCWAGGSSIWHRHSTDYGVTWSPIDSLCIGIRGLYPSMVRDGLQVHMVCISGTFDGVGGMFYQHSQDGGNSWDSQVKLVDGSNKPSMPYIAVSGSILHLLWSDQRLGHPALYYNRNPTGNGGGGSMTITPSVSGSQFCQGSPCQVTYTATGTFNAGNQFTAQLSDATGSFGNPVNIGSVTSTTSGIINSIIPKTSASGNQYKIRIISSNPQFTGTSTNAITINSLPIPVITGQDSVCKGAVTTFTTDSLAGINYFWSVTNGTIQGTATNSKVNVSFQNPGSGSVGLRLTNQLSGCTDSTIKNIIIVPLPQPIISGENKACQKSAQSYSTDSHYGSSYNWKTTSGSFIGSSTASGVNILWASQASATVTVIETNSFGCMDSSFLVVSFVNPPRPAFSGPAKVCENEIITYYRQKDSSTSFFWKVSGGVVLGTSTADTIIIQWPDKAGSGRITLTETNLAGCTDSTIKDISILPKPEFSINGKAQVCIGATESYNVPRDPDVVHLWSVTGGKIIGQSGDTLVNILWLSPQSGTISCKGSVNTNGCDNTEYFTVSMLSPPEPTEIIGKRNNCKGEITNYNYVSSTATNTQWIAENGQILGDPTKTSIDVLWKITGPAKLDLIRNNEGSECYDSCYALIQINEVPKPEINGKVTAKINSTQQYFTDNNPGNSYSWNVQNGSIIGNDDQYQVTVKWDQGSQGLLSVIETSPNDCIDSAKLTIELSPQDIKDSREGWLLSTNGMQSAEELNLTIIADKETIADISIYNYLGNSVCNYDGIRLIAGKNVISLKADPADNKLLKGVYFIQLHTDTKTLYCKLLLSN